MTDDLNALTPARKTALWNLGDAVGWQPAPHDGWRRAGLACTGLCDIGLAERRMNRQVSPPQPEYRLTAAGLEARARLAVQQEGQR